MWIESKNEGIKIETAKTNHHCIQCMNWSPQTLWNWPDQPLDLLLRSCRATSLDARCSMLDCQSSIFRVRSHDNCRYSSKTLVFLSVRTVWAAKYNTIIDFIAKTPRGNSLHFEKCAICLKLLVLHFARSRVFTSYLKTGLISMSGN